MLQTISPETIAGDGDWRRHLAKPTSELLNHLMNEELQRREQLVQVAQMTGAVITDRILAEHGQRVQIGYQVEEGKRAA